MTQKERVLHALRYRAVTAADFVEDGPFGGPPIMRVAARVEELRRDGYTINSDARVGPLALYVLVWEPPC